MLKLINGYWFTVWNKYSNQCNYTEEFQSLYLNKLITENLEGIGTNPFDIPVTTSRSDKDICDEILDKYKLLVGFWADEKNGQYIHTM